MKKKLPFKLKRRPSEGFYLGDYCCAQKCKNYATITDATKNFSEIDLPLCDHHWEVQCDR